MRFILLVTRSTCFLPILETCILVSYLGCDQLLSVHLSFICVREVCVSERDRCGCNLCVYERERDLIHYFVCMRERCNYTCQMRVLIIHCTYIYIYIIEWVSSLFWVCHFPLFFMIVCAFIPEYYILCGT